MSNPFVVHGFDGEAHRKSPRPSLLGCACPSVARRDGARPASARSRLFGDPQDPLAFPVAKPSHRDTSMPGGYVPGSLDKEHRRCLKRLKQFAPRRGRFLAGLRLRRLGERWSRPRPAVAAHRRLIDTSQITSNTSGTTSALSSLAGGPRARPFREGKLIPCSPRDSRRAAAIGATGNCGSAGGVLWHRQRYRRAPAQAPRPNIVLSVSATSRQQRGLALWGSGGYPTLDPDRLRVDQSAR